jgi:hypothetical protein
MNTTTQLRLQLLANGFTPLPNLGKTCYLKDWPRVEVTETEIARWGRRHKRFTSTGVRIEGGLAAIDFDIDDEIMDVIAERVFDRVPVLADESAPLPVRRGKGFKEAWFVRTAEPFKRVYSHAWIKPGGAVDDPAHRVEIFGGGSAREFGAFGAHSFDDEGNTLVEYRWRDESLLDLSLDDLPELSRADFVAICDIVSFTLEEAGWQLVTRSTQGEGDPDHVFDLTPDMTFDCNDGETRTLDELRAAADAGDLRCSAAWLEGPHAVRRDRCLVSLTRSGHVSIHETSSSVSHLEAGAKVFNPTEDLNLDRVAEMLREIKDRRANAIHDGDSYTEALEKALASFAWCPSADRVVPLWPRGGGEGQRFNAFRITMAKHGFEVVGPKGGTKFMNPCDGWMKSDARVTVEGIQTRPDQPRPLFEDDGGLWVNAYRPMVFTADDAAGGSAALGLRFLELLVPDDAERLLVMQWIAYKLRYPHVPMFALVMVAPNVFGTGRNTLGDLLGLMLGETYVREVPFETFTGKTYQSQYNEWQADALVVVVSESSESDGSNSQWKTKRNTYERLKLIVDPRPGRRVLVNVKGTRNYEARTCTSFLIATNHADALPIPENDRRFCVVTNGDPAPAEFWSELRAWMADRRNIAALSLALATVDMAGFNPFEPPLFAGKRRMAEESRSDLDEAIRLALGGMPGKVFTLDQVVRAVETAFHVYGLERPETMPIKTIRMAARRELVGVGERDSANYRMTWHGKRHRLYAKTYREARIWSDKDNTELTREVRRNGDLDGGGSVNVMPRDAG